MKDLNRKRALALLAGAVLATALLFVTNVSMVQAVIGVSSRSIPSNAVEQLRSRPAELLRPALQSSAAVSITMRDDLLIDADGSGDPGPGDTLQYTVVVTNSGGNDALGVMITNTLDAHTTLSGTLSVSPIAADDWYEVLGNTYISIGEDDGVLANDGDPDGGMLTIQNIGPNTTVKGGEITLNADGSFVYDPPVGFEGNDSFQYAIEDGEGLRAVGVMHFVVSDAIWYVDDTADDGGDGRLSAPFESVAAAQTVAGPGDIVFLYEGSYTGNLSLGSEQQLIGQGVDLAGGAGLTAPLGTILPAQTVSPTLSGRVLLGKNNTVRGLSVAHSGTTALSGTDFGSLTVSDVAIAGVGRGLNLENGSVSAMFDAITSTNSSNEGIRLINISGDLSIDSGEIDGADSAGYYVSNSRANVSYGGAIVVRDANAYAVHILNNSAGVLALRGTISGTTGQGRGISLTSNGGTTIHFEGAIDLETGSHTAFAASGGGTVTATGAGSTLTSSGAAAITMDSTTIGADGMLFERISAANSAKAIVLNNVGSGGFTVSGVGETGGSGGALQNISARAIEVINSDNITFKNMVLTNASTLDAGEEGVCDALHTTACNAAVYLNGVSNVTLDNLQIAGVIAEQGVNGISVDGFRLLNSTLSQCGNGLAEGCVKMRDLTGDVQITASELGGAAEKVVEIHNGSGNLDLTVTGSIFRDTQGNENGADGLEIITDGSAQAGVNVSGSGFLRLRTNGIQVNAQAQSDVDVSVTESTFDAEGAPGKGIELALTGESQMTFDVYENTRIHSYGGTAITVAAFDKSSVQGRVHANDDIQLGGAGTSGSGVYMQMNDDATGVVQISNNVIDNIGWDNGIRLLARPDLLEEPTGRLDAIVENNSITVVDEFGLYGIEVQARALNQACANVANNSVTGTPAAAFRVRGGNGGVVTLEGFTTDAETTWNSKGNTGSPVSESPSGTATSGVCARPNLARGEGLKTVYEAPDYRSGIAPATAAAVHSTTERVTIPSSYLAGAAWQQPPATSARLMSPSLQQTPDIEVGPFTLPASKVVTVTFQVQIDDTFPAGVAPQLESQAWVSGDNLAATASDDPDTAQANDATVTVLDAAPDLTLQKAGGSTEVTPGDIVSYELTYANVGNQHASGVVITETVPQHATFNAAASSPGWSCADGSDAGETCTIDLGVVAAGAGDEAVTFAVTVPDVVAAGATRIENAALIGDDGSGGLEAYPADNESSVNTTLIAQPDLQLSKQEGVTSVAPGGELVYTLTYTNAGNQGATGVVINEVVPEHTTFDAGASTSGWSCADGSAGGTTCTFSIGGVAGSASGTVTFAVNVDSPASAGAEQIVNSAGIEDDGANGADVDESDNSDSTQTILDAAPELTLEKSDGGASPGSGDSLIYSLALANVGDQTANGVILTETVPANTTFDATNSDARWACAPDDDAGSLCTLSLGDELDSGTDISFPFAVTIDSVLPAGIMQVENQAQAQATETAPVSSDDPETGEMGDATVTPLNLEADLAVNIDDGATLAVPGEALTYTVVVQNHGPDAVPGATVTDDLSTGVVGASWSCEAGAGASCGGVTGSGALEESVDLNAGALLTYTVSGMIDSTATGVLSSRAAVAGPANVNDPAPSNNSAVDDDTVLSPEVDLSLFLKESTDPVLAGSGSGNLTYVLTLNNRGPSLATDVTVDVTSELPTGVILDEIEVSAANASFGGGIWTVDTLNVGPSETLTATLTAVAHAAPGDDVISMRAEVTGAAQTIVAGGDDALTELTSIVRGIDIQVTVSESSDVVTAGLGAANLTYLVTATNTGPSAASGVSLTNTLSFPAGVSVVSMTPGNGTTWQESAKIWDIGDLAVGARETLTVTLNVGAGALPGTDVIENHAALLSANEDDLQVDNNEDSESTSVATMADLTLALDSDPDPAVAGMPLTYTVTITNQGPSHARNVIAGSELSQSLTPLWSSGCLEDPDGGRTCSLGTVEAGATVVFTNVVEVDSAAVDSVSSRVEVAADTEEASAGDEWDVESSDVERVSDLALALSATPSPVGAGQPLTYTVVISNWGPSRATGIAVSSTLPEAFAYEADSCDGASNESVWTWSPAELDAAGQATCHIRGVTDDEYDGVITATAEIVSVVADPDAANNTVARQDSVYDNSFSIGNVAMTEGDGGIATFTLTITRTSNAVDAAVDVSTEDLTATAGEDYTALSGSTVNFSAGGSLTETVAIEVAGDEIVELDETFLVKLSNPINGAIGEGEAGVTILDDDSATITIGDVSKAEGDIGTSAFTFELALSAAVDAAIEVSFGTTDGTAEDESGDGDYAATSGIVRFDGNVGEVQTIVVLVNGDDVEEADETFVVNLTTLDAQGRDVSFARHQAQGVIVNDDGTDARTYIYYFPLSVKQATLESGGSETPDEETPEEPTRSIPDLIPITPKGHRAGIDREYGGSIYPLK